jgi:uncharacterized protein (DUF302 family)
MGDERRVGGNAVGQPVEHAAPPGAPTEGVAHLRSPHSVTETVDRLTAALTAAGATVFAVVDHSGEAARVGMNLRDTKLVIFGSPAAGTPIMEAAPLAAIDLPLKVLVWADDDGAVWMSYLTPSWLAARHRLAFDVTGPLHAVEKLTAQIAAAGR